MLVFFSVMAIVSQIYGSRKSLPVRRYHLVSLLFLASALYVLLHSAPAKGSSWSQLSPARTEKLINDIAVSPKANQPQRSTPGVGF